MLKKVFLVGIIVLGSVASAYPATDPSGPTPPKDPWWVPIVCKIAPQAC